MRPPSVEQRPSGGGSGGSRRPKKGSSPWLAIRLWLTLHQLEVDTDPGFLEIKGQEMVCFTYPPGVALDRVKLWPPWLELVEETSWVVHIVHGCRKHVDRGVLVIGRPRRRQPWASWKRFLRTSNYSKRFGRMPVLKNLEVILSSLKNLRVYCTSW